MSLKKHRIIAQVTISIYHDVMASGQDEALRLAEDADMMPIMHDGSINSFEHWVADELDGEAENLTIEE